MKKHKKVNKMADLSSRNWVAKHARQFNKAQVFSDKTKYTRKVKHKNREPLPILFLDNIGNGFWFFTNGNLMSQRCIQTDILL